jgi:hypothetical protein
MATERKFTGSARGPTPDAATRLWTAVELVFKDFVADRQALGRTKLSKERMRNFCNRPHFPTSPIH